MLIKLPAHVESLLKFSSFTPTTVWKKKVEKYDNSKFSHLVKAQWYTIQRRIFTKKRKKRSRNFWYRESHKRGIYRRREEKRQIQRRGRFRESTMQTRVRGHRVTNYFTRALSTSEGRRSFFLVFFKSMSIEDCDHFFPTCFTFFSDDWDLPRLSARVWVLGKYIWWFSKCVGIFWIINGLWWVHLH